LAQTRVWSAVESAANTGFGFGVAILTQMLVFPWFGMHPTLAQNIQITAIFTVISVLRGYVVRRGFERWHRYQRSHRTKM